jgi:hypothetical protein
MRGFNLPKEEDEAKGVASSIIQQKKELEEEKRKDLLTKRINLRPTPEDLLQKNILRSKF